HFDPLNLLSSPTRRSSDLRNIERTFFTQLVSSHDFVIDRLDLTDEPRLIKSAAVGDNRHRLRHLQRCRLRVPLTDRQICNVAVEQFPAVSCFHVFVVRDASFRFAAQRDPALRAETELERPLDDRLRAGLNADLIKPRVARLSKRLDKIERALIAFFPIVKGEVANLNSRDALIKIVRTNGAGLERRDSNCDLEGRARRISRTESTRQKWNIRIVL